MFEQQSISSINISLNISLNISIDTQLTLVDNRSTLDPQLVNSSQGQKICYVSINMWDSSAKISQLLTYCQSSIDRVLNDGYVDQVLIVMLI